MTGGCAFVFPGQGTQRPGMGEHLRRTHPPARRMFEQASEILGSDLAVLCRRGPEARLRATEVAQPALFVTGCAYADFLQHEHDVRPAAAAGHSVGELCALVAAGVLPFEAGVALVGARGRLMARAPEGAMASIVGLDTAVVAALAAACADAPRKEQVVVAIVNAADDVVVSGHPAAVDRVAETASRQAGATVTRLRVGGAFHSPLMEPVVAEWAEHVRRAPLAEPSLPVPLNATGRVAGSLAEVRNALESHLTAPVLWGESIRALAGLGLQRGVECGDSRALRRINTKLGFDTIAARTPPDLARAVRSGALETTGAPS